MNEAHFHSVFDKLHIGLISHMYPTNKVRDAFVLKKLSDYYFSKLIPDFFYHTPLSSNYYPTIVATRVTLSLAFLLGFSYFAYQRSLSSKKDKSKKYSFNVFTHKYLTFEKEMILNEKNSKKKIIL
jgi:hypothetical protein